jgi:XTP/dITP diphosphohydrolase
MKPELVAFERLLKIMDDLREKCPWDKVQTFETLRHLTIEEVYELSDAIMKGDHQEIKKEIGDVLLHIVFYAKIGSETNDFTITEVINSLCEKLIFRHPHIYGDPNNNGKLVEVENQEQVKENWEKLKMKEGNKSVLGGVPVSLPAMIKAQRIQEKVRAVGFDWDEPSQVWDKVNEELAEFKAEMDNNADFTKKEDEFGDILFSLINYARFVGINPEDALEKTNRKFIHRFQYLEQASKNAGKQLSEMTLQEMDVYWNEAKKVNFNKG